MNFYLNWRRNYTWLKLEVCFLLSKYQSSSFDHAQFLCQLRQKFIQYLILKLLSMVKRNAKGQHYGLSRGNFYQICLKNQDEILKFEDFLIIKHIITQCLTLKLIKWTLGVLLNLQDFSLEGATTTKKSKQMFKTAVFSLGPHPHGCHWGLEVGKNPQNLIFQVWGATLLFQSNQKPKTSQKESNVFKNGHF